MDRQFVLMIVKLWLLTIPVIAFIVPQAWLVEKFLPGWAWWPAAFLIVLEMVLIIAWLLSHIADWISGE